MPIAEPHRLAERLPTKASARAATRNTMLNTISDRVQHSQEQPQALPHDHVLQRNQVMAFQYPETQLCKTPEGREPPSLQKPMRPLPHRSYTITRLIELGKNVQDSSNLLLRVMPEAIAENLFQYMGMDRSLRSIVRSRGLSDISNISHRSVISNNRTSEWEPSRQPRPAPRASDFHQTSRLQQHEGFVRFMKQHASPPHQRVTAGGRIVPTGPLSPPPMFDYASLNGLVQGQQVKSHSTNGGQTNFSHNVSVNTHPASSQTTLTVNPLTTQSNQALGSQVVASPDMVREDMKSSGTIYTPQPVISSMVPSSPTQFALIPLGLFPDGTALISCNGVCYRSYWNGVTTFMEPITTGQSVPILNDRALNGPFTPLGRSFYDIEPKTTMPPPVSGQHSSLASIQHSTIPNLYQPQPTDSNDTSLPLFDEKSLKAQLTNLDKHLALHHYDIGPAERVQLVSQRKTLVQAIAKIRNDREPITPKIPIVATSGIGSRKSSTLPSLTSLPRVVTGQPEESASRDTYVNGKDASKKCLSPSAPAFIPRGALESLPGNQELCSPPKKSAVVTLTRPMMTKGETMNDIVVETPADKMFLRKTSSVSQTQAYVEVDPWDPAMKVIPLSMTWYARKYNTESTGVEKKYCTTVEEFQEAIRRVREQARMWGCVGGNSKDPAYDAEEDIWYAIKDEYPIPLPTKIPDHITCPRPWNWYDSAFNVKATIEPRINMRGDIFEDVYPQPKLEAASMKISFQDILKPSKKEVEASKETHGPFYDRSTPGDSDHLQRDKLPFEKPIRDTLADRHHKQQSKASTPTRWTNGAFSGHANSLQAPAIRKGDTATPFPLTPDSSSHSMQKEHDATLSHTGGLSSHLHPVLYAIRRSNDQLKKGRQTLAQCPVVPSFVAVAAAQVAYGSKNPVSNSPTKEQDEAFQERLPTTRNQLCTLNSAECRFTQASQTLDKLSHNQSHCTSTVDGLQEVVLHSSASPTQSHKRHEVSNALTAESKGAWGPEQLYTAVEGDNAPKVKIPEPNLRHHAAYGQDHMNRLNEDWRFACLTKDIENPRPHELRFENVASIPGNRTDTFLKDMLKDPRYSFTLQQDAHAPIETTLAYQVASVIPRKLYGLSMMEKENTSSAHGNCRNHHPAGPMIGDSPLTRRGSDLSQFQITQEAPILNTKKANSSLASSVYQARGYLPLYHGAGRERAASIYRQQSHHPQHKKARVNLPNSSSLAQQEHSAGRSDQGTSLGRYSYNADARYLPTTFGYDGSEDPPTNDDATSGQGKANEKEQKSFDCKGVTTACFDQPRPDTDNEWHRSAVDDFFRELHKNEVRHMMARQRKNTKTAP